MITFEENRQHNMEILRLLKQLIGCQDILLEIDVEILKEMLKKPDAKLTQPINKKLLSDLITLKEDYYS